MSNQNEELKLIRMNEVEATEIDWLWYPYIPFGKISVIQGDPGDGKTTVVLAIAAAVTTGMALPESEASYEPMTVIFQTAEDGLSDTVKPRLIQSGADCERVIVIDESEKELSLSNIRIEQAIIMTGAKLFIIDPLQAYLGADVDMHRANQVRPILKRIILKHLRLVRAFGHRHDNEHLCAFGFRVEERSRKPARYTAPKKV